MYEKIILTRSAQGKKLLLKMPPKGNSLRFRGQEFFDRSYDSSPMRDIDYSKLSCFDLAIYPGQAVPIIPLSEQKGHIA